MKEANMQVTARLLLNRVRSEMISAEERTLAFELEQYANNRVKEELDRLYNWLQEEKREPANTKFTAGPLRNVAREVEFLLKGKQDGKN